METLIVEDEGPARRRLEQMVLQHPRLHLAGSCKSGTAAIEAIKTLQPDLVLMDIQLKDKTAFEVLEAIPANITFQIIFVTAYDHYAVKAFEVEAVDYLLKPFDEQRFKKSIDRLGDKQAFERTQLMKSVLSRISGGDPSVVIKEGKKDYFFKQKEIRYIQSEGYHIRIVCQQQQQLIRKTLKSVQGVLPQNFIRINKSIIINSRYVSQLVHHKQSTSILLSSGEQFSSSPTYVQNLEELIGRG